MAEPQLKQVFGTGCNQTATDLVISKNDLVEVGLTPSASNTPEALIVALLLKAGKYLNDANQTINPEIQVLVDQDDFQSLVSRNNATYRQATFTVRLQSPDVPFPIDPDNY